LKQLTSYFPGEEPELTALLDRFLASLAGDLQEIPFRNGVRALLLAGGYGRGEGGIFRESEDAGAQLYNDLEFYLITANGADEEAIAQWCTEKSHAGDKLLGIEVEFKILGETAFRGAEPSMFYYDLISAHRLVFGPENFAESLPARLRDPALIPAQEATRLLFNRGTGLFYSWVALESGDARVTNGFIERNHAKTRLALADAVLAFNGRYHFSCRERHSRLGEPMRKVPRDWPLLTAWHAHGVRFKLHPRHLHPDTEELLAAQTELSRVWMNTFLWLESLRLGEDFQTASNYAARNVRLFPGTKPLRNFALHLRDRFKRGAALPGWFDYPRAALQRSLVLFLQSPPGLADGAKYLGEKRDADAGRLHDAYERWWKFYN